MERAFTHRETVGLAACAGACRGCARTRRSSVRTTVVVPVRSSIELDRRYAALAHLDAPCDRTTPACAHGGGAARRAGACRHQLAVRRRGSVAHARTRGRAVAVAATPSPRCARGAGTDGPCRRHPAPTYRCCSCHEETPRSARARGNARPRRTRRRNAGSLPRPRCVWVRAMRGLDSTACDTRAVATGRHRRGGRARSRSPTGVPRRPY
jgi:hypothetical protein